MQRVRCSGNGDRPVDYFPTGLMGCSDARFIVEAIDAAVSNESCGQLLVLPLTVRGINRPMYFA